MVAVLSNAHLFHAAQCRVKMSWMRVFVLTYCRHADQLYGSTLLFGTLRTGFPDAEVFVADNNSIAEARGAIESLARGAGCRFSQFNKDVAHADFIEYVLGKYDGEIVFVDPDVLFWERCDQWSFDALLAGRLIPRFRDEYSRTITSARLHTSFLWVPDAGRLREAIAELQRTYWDFRPFQPYSYRGPDGWTRLDCAASLHAALGSRSAAFTDAHLEAYDHLFLGSHVDLVLPHLNDEDRNQVLALHHLARHDPASLKGIWRRQQEYFERRAV